MTTLTLVACAAKKQSVTCAAKDLYCSAWFKKARRFAEKSQWWWILSAKHGLLHPSRIIDPYDETLAQKSADARRLWSARIAFQVCDIVRAANIDKVIILGGKNYARTLSSFLEAEGIAVETPLAGLGIGQQLKWLKEHA